MKAARPAPLDESQWGETNLFGFIVTVNYEMETLTEILKAKDAERLSREPDVPEDIRNYLSTLSHEVIHFIHSVATSYMYRQAIRMWGEVRRCRNHVRDLPNGQPIHLPLVGVKGISETLADFGRKSTLLSAPPIEGITAYDVLEGAAVFISHRMHLPDMGHDDYLGRLVQMFGDASSPYCNAYRLGAEFFGEDFFEVFSPLCFFALCSADPGSTYCRSLQAIGKSGFLRRNRRPSVREIGEIVAASGVGRLRTAAEELQNKLQHPILTPYMLQITRNPANPPIVEFAARPYAYENVDLFELFMPPIVRHRGVLSVGARKLPDFLGLPGDVPDEERRRQNTSFLVHFMAVCGAAVGMEKEHAERADCYMQCPHTACPYYSLRLCHTFVPVPPSFEECGFVSTFEDVFGKPLALMEGG